MLKKLIVQVALLLFCFTNVCLAAKDNMAWMSLLLGQGGTVITATKVIGYMFAQKGLQSQVDSTDLSKLTHINIAFLNPDVSGILESGGQPVCMDGTTSSDIAYVISKAHQANVKVLPSMAGGVLPVCSGNWANLLQPANRGAFVDKIVAFVNKHNFDGIDIDIEWDELQSVTSPDDNYTPFIQELKNQLQPQGKLVTAATASLGIGMLPIAAIPHFDFITIMSYDLIGPSWGTAGSEHSPYSFAVSNINTWKSRGLTKDKLVLGVPFYGYGFGSYKTHWGFDEIISNFGASAANQDLIGSACDGCSYVTYNGIPTMRAKTQLALQEGSGVMIWELSTDATGGLSLLNIIDEEINGGSSSSTSSSSSSGGSCVGLPVWSASTVCNCHLLHTIAQENNH